VQLQEKQRAHEKEMQLQKVQQEEKLRQKVQREEKLRQKVQREEKLRQNANAVQLQKEVQLEDQHAELVREKLHEALEEDNLFSFF